MHPTTDLRRVNAAAVRLTQFRQPQRRLCRRRLAPEAVVNLDWHNEMSNLILDINARIEDAADDRARGVIVRKLKRALEET